MGKRVYSNTAVATAISPGIDSAETTFQVGDTTGWPQPTGDDIAIGFLDVGSPATVEAFSYTGKTSNTLTGVTRGIDGTSARSHADGTVVVHGGSASDFEALAAFEAVSKGLIARGIDTETETAVSGVSFDTVVSLSNVPFESGRRYRIVGHARYIVSSDAERKVQQQITIGGTVRATSQASIYLSSTARSKTVINVIEGITIASPQDVALEAQRVEGSTSLLRRASGNVPSELVVYDVGPA